MGGSFSRPREKATKAKCCIYVVCTRRIQN